MSAEFDEFEALLAGQPLAAPSADLDARVAAALKPAPAPRWGWAIAATLAISALTSFLLFFPGAARRARPSLPEPPGPRIAPPRSSAPRAPEAPPLVQVSETRPLELAGARRVGIVRIPNHGAFYKVIVRRLRRVQWREGPERVRFSVLRPVEEVVYVPVPED